MATLRYELQAEMDNRRQERAASGIIALSTWANARPFVYRILTAPILPTALRNAGWWLYWHIWLRLSFWTYYPVMNPATSRLVLLIIIAIVIKHTRSRLG